MYVCACIHLDVIHARAFYHTYIFETEMCVWFWLVYVLTAMRMFLRAMGVFVDAETGEGLHTQHLRKPATQRYFKQIIKLLKTELKEARIYICHHLKKFTKKYAQFNIMTNPEC